MDFQPHLLSFLPFYGNTPLPFANGTLREMDRRRAPETSGSCLELLMAPDLHAQP